MSRPVLARATRRSLQIGQIDCWYELWEFEGGPGWVHRKRSHLPWETLPPDVYSASLLTRMLAESGRTLGEDGYYEISPPPSPEAVAWAQTLIVINALT